MQVSDFLSDERSDGTIGEARPTALTLFWGERSPVLVSLPSERVDARESVCARTGLKWCMVGSVGDARFLSGGMIDPGVGI